MHRALRLSAIVLLVWAGPASADPFMVDGARLDLPAPEGFCFTPRLSGDPRNADIEHRQPPAATVIAMAEPCAGAQPSPIAPGTMSYGRWLLLLDNGVPRRLAAGSTRASALKASIEGMPVVTTGIVFQLGFLSANLTSGVIGHDGVANYRALVYPVSAPMGGSLTQAGIEGETVLLGRPVAFQLFDTYRDLDTYAPLERQVKTLMAQAARQDPAGVAPREAPAAKPETPHYAPRLEFVEVVQLLAKALLIAGGVFAASAWFFRRKSKA